MSDHPVSESEHMPEWRHLIITVHYEPAFRYGHSLAWIAPELRTAGLRLINDRLSDPDPSRTWAGLVNRATFDDFADAWRLPHICGTPQPTGDQAGHATAYDFAFDGMNWERDGASPVVYVSVRVTVFPAHDRAGAPANAELVAGVGC
jgi:hypothetical protein